MNSLFYSTVEYVSVKDDPFYECSHQIIIYGTLTVYYIKNQV